jgi:hypothetical protein
VGEGPSGVTDRRIKMFMFGHEMLGEQRQMGGSQPRASATGHEGEAEREGGSVAAKLRASARSFRVSRRKCPDICPECRGSYGSHRL